MGIAALPTCGASSCLRRWRQGARTLPIGRRNAPCKPTVVAWASRACYGRGAGVFERLMQSQGWPEDLIALALEASPDSHEKEPQGLPLAKPEVAGSIDAGVAAESTLSHTLVDNGNALLLSIALPEGVEPAAVELDLAAHVVSATAHAEVPLRLHVELPRLVDPDLAPPAKFKKRGRWLVLELPCA